MHQFVDTWEHAEKEQHTRLLSELKRELVAKRRAEQAQALPLTAQPPMETLPVKRPVIKCQTPS
ncbi:hypothetical protein [Stenomitos frigidus]|uniref:Uncharacterized protein n=1 Tax=Stenomitos frigidus ULC18 TaxID=2107698 RepID=A0A2T1EMH0_9CYAN|nr:hypothetical protein [Stenomitos frigidus]PSB33934.1 hypothetical protein C7B82_03465 [Stenomitos frigidus ULC18]